MLGKPLDDATVELHNSLTWAARDVLGDVPFLVRKGEVYLADDNPKTNGKKVSASIKNKIVKKCDEIQLNKIKNKHRFSVVRHLDIFARSIMGDVTIIEPSRWEAKNQGAIAILQNDNGLDSLNEEIELLQHEANENGETVDELAKKIVENNTVCKCVISEIMCLRRKVFKQIETAKTEKEIVEISSEARGNFDVILNKVVMNAKDKAKIKIEKLGKQ